VAAINASGNRTPASRRIRPARSATWADAAFPQYLLGALIFRAVADQLARPHLHRPDSDDPYDPYKPAVTLAVRLAQASQ
jgi:hypothetical protein